MTIPVVLLPAPNTVFLTNTNLVLGFETFPAVSIGNYRFLKDHYINDEYIFAGEIHEMFTPWTPTADVEPLDTKAVNAFYAAGPSLGACIRTQFTTAYIYKPSTYWHQIAPNLWALSGLGAAMSPVPALIGRIEDKST